MPRKAKFPAVGKDLRIRISVELDDERAAKIEDIITKLRLTSFGRVSVSQVIRAALDHFYLLGEWAEVPQA